MADTHSSLPTRSIPGPAGHYLLGVWPDLKRDPFLTKYFEWRQTYGDIVRVEAPRGMGWFFLAHPDDIEQMLVGSYRDYRKGPLWNHVRVLLGNGVLTSDGETWRERRRIMQPVFAAGHHQKFAGVMYGSIAAMIARWRQRSRAGEALDVMAEMTHLTLHNAGCALFGPTFADRVPVMGAAMTELVTLVAVTNKWHTRFHPRFRRALLTLRQNIDEMISERQLQEARGEAPPADLLTALLHAPTPLQRSELHDEIMTFLFTGHETTAIGLAWAFYSLARHPEAWDEVAAEVEAAVGNRQPTLEDVAQFTYTRQVFQETLRLYPPVWGEPRQNTQDVVLRGYQVPAGSLLVALAYVTHRHPDFWANPEAFDPTRFAPVQVASRHRYAYFPFGGGPRMCIGAQFAMIEGVLLLASVVQQGRLSLVPGQMIVPRLGATLRPNLPVYMRFTPLH